MTMREMMEAAGLERPPATEEEENAMLKKCMTKLADILDDRPLDLLTCDK